MQVDLLVTTLGVVMPLRRFAPLADAERLACITTLSVVTSTKVTR